MNGVNKAIIVGVVGRDPEVRDIANGALACNISLATNEAWKDKATGEKKEATEWHRVVFYNKLADIVNKYVSKGSKLYVEGKLKTHKWQDKEGNDRFTTQIIANNMQLLGDKKPQSEAGWEQSQNDSIKTADSTNKANTTTEYFDDDIPF